LPLQIDSLKVNKVFDPTDLESDYETKVKSFWIEIIKEALKRTNGNKSAAAIILNITERHLRSLLERLYIYNSN